MNTTQRARAIEVIAAVLRVPPASLTEHSSPDDVGTWTSIRHLQLILALEEEFSIQFPAGAMESLQTVDALLTAITERTA